MSPAIDITNQKFGRLTALFATDKRINKKVVWNCRCDCTNAIDVDTNSLRSGNTNSCGCLRVDATRKRSIKHGAASDFKKTSLYRVWVGIKSRCYNMRHPKYVYYGERGIKVYRLWQNDFVAFRDYMLNLPNCPLNASTAYRAELTIDRKNNDGHYIPGNLRWATRKDQAHNRRSNIMVIVHNTQMTLREAVDAHSVLSYNTVRMRLLAGWLINDALTKPLHTRI